MNIFVVCFLFAYRQVCTYTISGNMAVYGDTGVYHRPAYDECKLTQLAGNTASTW